MVLTVSWTRVSSTNVRDFPAHRWAKVTSINNWGNHKPSRFISYMKQKKYLKEDESFNIWRRPLSLGWMYLCCPRWRPRPRARVTFRLAHSLYLWHWRLAEVESRAVIPPAGEVKGGPVCPQPSAGRLRTGRHFEPWISPRTFSELSVICCKSWGMPVHGTACTRWCW
jgi:hypothetical protein